MTRQPTTKPKCDGCHRPVADNARLCARCSEHLARDLGDIGSLAGDLQTTRLRQSRMGGQETGVLSRSHELPLPWDPRAAEAASVLRSTVVAWVRVVLDERGARLPDDTMRAMGAFLLTHLEWLRHHQAAAECADKIGHAAGMARHVVDRAQDKLYVGPCREDIDAHDDRGPACCVVDLYVRRGAPVVACPNCAAEHDVAARNRWLLAIANDQLVTAADLSKFLTAYGEPLTAERVRTWAVRKQLLAHGQDHSGRPLYRVSEATELLTKLMTGRVTRSA